MPPSCALFLADLQSGHGLRCYGNTTRTRNVSEYMQLYSPYAWLHLLSCPFEVQCMTFLGYKSLYIHSGTPLRSIYAVNLPDAVTLGGAY